MASTNITAIANMASTNIAAIATKKEQLVSEASTNINAAIATMASEASSNITAIAAEKEQPKVEKKSLQEERAVATAAESVTNRIWTEIESLGEEFKDKEVLIRGRVQTTRTVGKISFLVLRRKNFTVQCVVTVSGQMVKFSDSLNRESVVDVLGIVCVPNKPIKGTTQQVEIRVKRISCVSNAVANLPFNFEDAARSEVDIEKAGKAGEKLVRVNQDTRLNFRVLDTRTPANQGIFYVQSQVSRIFTEKMQSQGFLNIHTPKLNAGSSEGGSAVFTLQYKGQQACLAQSPQLHKQMAICGDFNRVFEIGAVFRAEDSYTHRHLCEFTGLDVEMEIYDNYFEVIGIVDSLFVAIFDGLKERCKKELEAIGKQYPFEPLKYLRKSLVLTFQEGIQMLKEAGIEVEPLGDLNTETERKLGQLVKEKYETDFYILHRYPLAARPFYTMPCEDDPLYSNSFDVFLRGEEIISGAQRIHDPELLERRAKECGINVKTISTYIDAFRYGVPPHGGFGVGLERVVMLYCALDNIRKTSLFPRDSKRLAP
ncbi:aspartate--tRNA ligase [Ranunculus cassubicifolius]